MPRNVSPIPRLQHHRASGQARVRIHGRDHYLGPHGTPEARERYDRLIAEWLAAGRQLRPMVTPSGSTESTVTVNEILLRFLQWAQGYYGDGERRSKEYVNLTHALKPVRELYGRALAADFGPKSLKAVRQHMVEAQQLCRNEVNKRVGRIKRVFKWAVAEELVPPAVFEGLRAVDGLRRGRTGAREKPPVRPVDDVHVERVLPFLSPVVATMIRLQRLTGMRPGEVVQMRLCDLDRSQDLWKYQPSSHKTDHLGMTKIVPLGPQVQALLAPFLDRAETAFLFSPVEAERWRHAHRVQQRNPDRKTPVYPSELRARERRLQQAKNHVSRRPKRDHYDVDAYRRAITYGIQKAKRSGVEVDHWHPHQLRHARATEIRRLHGVEAAQVALGHTRADVTEIYAERNLKLAEQIAREMG